MAVEDPTKGPGERLVALLCCVERTMDTVEQRFPAVDHLAVRRTAPDPAAVAAALTEQGPSGVLESFEAWRRLLEDFEAASTSLAELRNGVERLAPRPKPQEVLAARIEEVRQCRQALEAAASDVRRRVIAEIDSALAHESARAS